MVETKQQTTSDLPDRRIPALQDILDAGAEVVTAQREEETAKEEAKVRKGRHKAARVYLAGVMDDARSGRIHNFADADDEEPTLFEGQTPTGEDWREVPLAELLGENLPGEDKPHIPEGILKKLAENAMPIVTLGDLTDWVNEKGDFWHKDIPGLGATAADKITAATDAFWQTRRDATRRDATRLADAEATPGPSDDEGDGD